MGEEVGTRQSLVRKCKAEKVYNLAEPYHWAGQEPRTICIITTNHIIGTGTKSKKQQHVTRLQTRSDSVAIGIGHH